MKYLQSPNSKNVYGLYGSEIGPGHLVAIIECEPSVDGDKLIRLLAAAPDLFEACEVAHSTLSKKLKRFRSPLEQVAIDKLATAIAKTRGQ